MAEVERASEVTADQQSLFDRFADHASTVVSRAPFFAFCVLLVVVWLPSYFAFGNIDTWQLIINTITTIVTFLLVALLQNSQTRSDLALQQKLNAIADGLASLMAAQKDLNRGRDLGDEIDELRAAVGLEQRESA
jgi:low affinity Fe/Cu permease